MSARTRSWSSSVFLTLGVCALGVQDGVAQEVRARVVDEQSRSSVVGAAVMLLTTDSTEITMATTGPDGFFQLSAPAPGSYLVQIQYPGYATLTRSVAMDEGQALIPAFVLRVTAIRLDTLEVEAPRGALTPHGVVGFSRPSHLLAGERIAGLERAGVSFLGAVLQLGGSVRVKSVGRFTCIESTRQTSRSGCNMVAIILDGVNTGLSGPAAMQFVHYLHLYDFESVEYLSPMDAGFRYGFGASDRGALVLWTRGSGPYKSKARGGGR
jgi:hypothetical protein